MSLSLESFLNALEDHEERVPLTELTALMRCLSLSLEDVREYIRFDTHEYQRNLIREGPAFQALLLCWSNGQRSPIHDHRGSSCGVVVLQGTLTETVFERNDKGWIYAARSSELHEGDVCGSDDMDTHQISNLDPAGRPLVTLHVYSPPLRTMGVYSLVDNSVELWTSPVSDVAPTGRR